MAWNHILQVEREKRGWTSKDLAEQVGANLQTVQEWERGAVYPRPQFRLKLAEVFGKTLEELELVPAPKARSIEAKQEAAIAQVAEADPANIQAIAAATQALINSYYQSGLDQSQRSLRWSLIWGGIGFLFLLGGIAVFVLGKPAEIAYASGVSAVIVGAFASIFLHLYRHASDQLAAFRVDLVDTQRLPLANSMCEKLQSEQQQTSRAEIIRLIVTSATTIKKQERFFLPQDQKHR